MTVLLNNVKFFDQYTNEKLKINNVERIKINLLITDLIS